MMQIKFFLLLMFFFYKSTYNQIANVQKYILRLSNIFILAMVLLPHLNLNTQQIFVFARKKGRKRQKFIWNKNKRKEWNKWMANPWWKIAWKFFLNSPFPYTHTSSQFAIFSNHILLITPKAKSPIYIRISTYILNICMHEFECHFFIFISFPIKRTQKNYENFSCVLSSSLFLLSVYPFTIDGSW